LVSPLIAETTTTTRCPSRRKPCDLVGHLLDALEAADGSAAEFLDEQRHLSAQRLADPGRYRFHHCRQCGQVRAAALGHVRPSAALAAKTAGELAHQVAGPDAIREVFGHAGDQGHLALIAGGREQDHGAAELVLALVHDLPRRAPASAPSMLVASTLTSPTVDRATR
jgi:hypothetical protein